MDHPIKPLCILFISISLSFAAMAASGLTVVPAREVVIADLLFQRRPVIVFADSPEDPNFIRQMDLLALGADDLAERDVIVIADTDPAALSPLRKALRPRGFSLVLMDKDWKPVLRKPLPWDVREITRSIDKFPLALTEELKRYPAGR